MFRPSGFPEYSPSEQLVFDAVKEIIEKNYAQYGFAHIQTPAVEANKVLLSKNGEDAGKQIFGLYGLAQGTEDTKDYALHFDLTVPFARYVLDWENDIVFPFKRYQIQPVWRGERSQRGRFREFRQSDIDVIWQDDKDQKIGKNLYYDAEMLFVIAKTLGEVIDTFFNKKAFTLHVNNRYLLSGFFSQFSSEVVPQLYTILDKYYKVSFEDFTKELEKVVSKDEVKKIIAFVKTGFKDLNPKLVDNDLYRRGYEELQQVLAYVEQLNTENIYKIIRDPCIIRGLDYYTGTVYETFIDDDIALGSISSGGRYENLTGYINPKKNLYSGVGGSIGLSRMVYMIVEQSKPENTTATQYLFVHFKETEKETLALLQTYSKKGNIVEYYPSAEKLGKQFAYADKKGIPYVIILGEGEKEKKIYKIKNMKTGEEQEKSL